MPEKPLMSFNQLAAAATALNNATDDLKRTVAALDQKLRTLNLGLVVWVTIELYPDPDGMGAYEREEIGYAKIDGVWGIGIRRLAGHQNRRDEDKVRDVWVFDEAPRELRLRGVEKLPELLDELGKLAMDNANKINTKLAEVRAFAVAVGILVPPPPPPSSVQK